MKIAFTIFTRLPSKHEFSANTKDAERGIFKRYQRNFFYAIKEGVQLAGIRWHGNTSYFKEKVRVSLVIHGKFKRMPDVDNYLLSAGKLIVDQFFSTKTRQAAIELIPDDREKFIEWGKVEFKRGNPMVDVWIEEIEGEVL